jgi:uncharacterized membrane protein
VAVAVAIPSHRQPEEVEEAVTIIGVIGVQLLLNCPMNAALAALFGAPGVWSPGEGEALPDVQLL